MLFAVGVDQKPQLLDVNAVLLVALWLDAVLKRLQELLPCHHHLSEIVQRVPAGDRPCLRHRRSGCDRALGMADYGHAMSNLRRARATASLNACAQSGAQTSMLRALWTSQLAV